MNKPKSPCVQDCPNRTVTCKMMEPEIMEFGLRILDWCSRMWPYALMTPKQLASKKDWRKWKDAKNCVEQSGSDLHRDSNGLRNHDGAGDISLD